MFLFLVKNSKFYNNKKKERKLWVNDENIMIVIKKFKFDTESRGETCTQRPLSFTIYPSKFHIKYKSC